MKLNGSVLLPGTREQVWKILTEPEELARLLPGCERLVADGPNRYKVDVKFGLAAITGKYAGTVELSEAQPPERLRLKMQSKGAPGFVNGEGLLTLNEKGSETEVAYEGAANVGGLIASVGQRLLESAARKILQQFFESAASRLREMK